MISIMSEHFTQDNQSCHSEQGQAKFSLRQQGIHPNLFLQICLKLGAV